MKQVLKIIPIPMSGLMLAFISLANLLHSIDRTIFGHFAFIIGGILFLLLLSKLLFAWSTVVQEMQNPIIASVSPTFTMGTMSISSGLHIYNVSELMIHTIWFLGAIGQFMIVLYFIKTFIWKNHLTISNIFPSWFILFVGLAMMPLTAGNLSSIVTKGIVFFAIASFIILVPIIATRVFIRKDLPEPTIPMLTILTAPASLSLAAYLQQFDGKLFVVVILFAIAQILYLLVLTKLPGALKLPFYPSYAAFTFPLIVTATATQAFILYLTNHGITVSWLPWLANFELIVAIVIICYVFIRYLNYFVFQLKQQRIKQQMNEHTAA